MSDRPLTKELDFTGVYWCWAPYPSELASNRLDVVQISPAILFRPYQVTVGSQTTVLQAWVNRKNVAQ
jgi:hypothetical protein